MAKYGGNREWSFLEIRLKQQKRHVEAKRDSDKKEFFCKNPFITHLPKV